MAPPPRIFRLKPRRGVSELYAAVLMIGVTLSLGSIVVAAAASQFSLASNSESLEASINQGSADVQIGYVYAAVAPSGTCPDYGGYQEGTELVVALFDYGTAGFTPGGFVVNATNYAGAYPTISPGTLAEYTIPLLTCAHSSGQTVLAYDSAGEEVEFGT